jgi:hypothetical protein
MPVRKNRVVFVVSDLEKKWLARIAKKLDRTASDFLRMCIRDTYKSQEKK